jgi:WhiB family transcriptional regulator, redox-sensing transcriptional regulator
MHRDDQAVSALLREAEDVGAALPCANNPQLWFSEQIADLELAKAGCRRCPLRGPCLAGAVERGESCGVWGGEILQRGHVLAVKRPPGRPPKRPGKARRP